MRALLGITLVLVAVGCSNACPAPVVCSAPHPSYCPCLIEDAGAMARPDAYVEPVDASLTEDAGAADAGPTTDAGSADAGSADAGAADAGAADAGSPDAG